MPEPDITKISTINCGQVGTSWQCTISHGNPYARSTKDVTVNELSISHNTSKSRLNGRITFIYQSGVCQLIRGGSRLSCDETRNNVIVQSPSEYNNRIYELHVKYKHQLDVIRKITDNSLRGRYDGLVPSSPISALIEIKKKIEEYEKHDS